LNSLPHSMISFENTENAFKGKSSRDLQRSYLLFSLIGNPALVKTGAWLGPLSLKLGMKPLIKSTIYKQFVGGETIEECAGTIRELARYRIGGILDYSVEGNESEQDFDNCLAETLETINTAKNNPDIPFCVFKVTGLARVQLLEKVSAGAQLSPPEESEWQRVRARVHRICQSAFESAQKIFIDAEESWIQEAIDRLANEAMSACNRNEAIVYNTYQLYRHDRLAYLQESIRQAKTAGYHIGAKLVRGAYMEKERARAAKLGYASPIQPRKPETDHDFNEAVKICIKNIDVTSVCAGTHNEESSLLLVSLMKENGIDPADKRIYFSQLYGMSDHISYNLSLNGYNVAKYVPYGPVKEVLPYLIRRAQENTSVKGQTGRELALIKKERKRRASLASR
jgi:proline dehydrogenase